MATGDNLHLRGYRYKLSVPVAPPTSGWRPMLDAMMRMSGSLNDNLLADLTFERGLARQGR